MDTKILLDQAKAMEGEIVSNRRTVHGYAELGFDIPQTFRFVMERLTEYGCSPYPVGKAGICCDLGREKGPTILLRADMDALPMEERSGMPFAAANGNAHTCGHDAHSAMLLGVARLLKSHENELKGRVRLMFQPAEELLAGAVDMIEAGVLAGVDAAVGLHIAVGTDYSRTGMLLCPEGVGCNSGDAYTIFIQGKSAHGSMPEKGVDAILIAARIIEAFQTLVSREVEMDEPCVLLVGTIEGGTSANSVAESAKLGVSLRTGNAVVRERMKRRIVEVAQSVAATYRGFAEVCHEFGSPPLENDKTLREFTRETLRSVFGEEWIGVPPKVGGEDFAHVSVRVPSVFLLLGCGSPTEGYTHSFHEPEMTLNESVFWKGTAAMTICAMTWLEQRGT